jgi:hypothetical protein
MKCRKCGARMRKRTIEPYGLKRPITVYECTSALCEYDEDEYQWRRRFHEHHR